MGDRVAGDYDDRFVLLDAADLSGDALRGLIEEFVSRDGTDYGHLEKSLEEKVDAVLHQLDSGGVRIVFDCEAECANLMLARDLAAHVAGTTSPG